MNKKKTTKIWTKSISKFTNLKPNDIWDHENIYHLKTDTIRISKLVAHYEIYKKILQIKGDVIECGVFKGISLTRFLTFREILENHYSRKIYGFDVFGKFPKPKYKKDKSFLDLWEKNAGDGIDFNELNKIFLDKKFKNYEIVKGDVKNTIVDLIKKKPNIKISLLHLDMDIYEPTIFVLKTLYPKVVRGGLILIDDFKSVYGATKATKEFLKINNKLRLKKLNFGKACLYFIEKK